MKIDKSNKTHYPLTFAFILGVLLIPSYWYGFSVLTEGERVFGALVMYGPMSLSIVYIFSVSLTLTFIGRKMSKERRMSLRKSVVYLAVGFAFGFLLFEINNALF
jgi:apolipoprotein N-acyltransferase